MTVSRWYDAWKAIIPLSQTRPSVVAAYCAAHAEDVMSCDGAPGGGVIALLDPLAVPFPREGLTAVTMPVLLLRPEQSQLGAENARGLAADLPKSTAIQMLPGEHFTFTDTCSQEQQAATPILCRDPPGVDRAKVQAEIEAKVVVFFRDHL